MPTGTPDPTDEIALDPLLAGLGPHGVIVLAALAAFLLLRSRSVRKAAYRLVRSALRRLARVLRHWVWARRYGLPMRVAARLLDPDRWDGMVTARQLPGLKRGKVRRTPSGVAVHVTLTRALTLDMLAARTSQLETGLGLRAGSVRVLSTGRADRAVLELTVRDPLARPLLWQPPAGPVRLADPVHLATTPHGDHVTLDVRQRIGIFGTSGSGKSCVQRTIGAHIVQAIDADLTVIDLKQGLESQHFEGKATRITTTAAAAAYTDWLLDVEFPRRAKRMLQLQTSTWRETADDRALAVMIDEGNVLTRDFKPDQLKRFFTAVEQGRALGVYFVWVTQFPKSTNLPTELRSQLNVRVCLRLESSQESAVVFKDETAEGWEPHKLRDHWLLVKSSKHRAPVEAKAVFLDETRFRQIAPDQLLTDAQTPAPAPAPVKEPAAPATGRPAPKAPTVADDITTVLLVSTEPLSLSEIARRASRSKAAVHAALGKLADAGAVTRDTDGRHQLVLANSKQHGRPRLD
jgi:hypothetical protein